RPLDENEKKMVQGEIENIYAQFKQRVADGRKKDTASVEMIAQGRVWTGQRAKDIGLIDRFGGIQDAIDCAANLAKLKDFRVKEYPEPKNLLDRFLGTSNSFDRAGMMKREIGEDNYAIYQEVLRIRQMTNTIQTRLPFQLFIR
ncbi:MAG: signal peptidase, partial [Chitinophagaceae bacterium]|nr:signal peptidase [Chitinophagaceae bacterium]